MKIVCLLGSPRLKGNSATLAKHFCDTSERLGAEVQTYALNELDYRGCQACDECDTVSEKCVLQDDLTPVLEAIRDTDALVLASPIYFGQVSSQLKTFIDRTHSFIKPDYKTNPNPSRLPRGKILVFIQTQEQEDERIYADIVTGYYRFFNWFGFDEYHLIRACGVHRMGDVEKRPEVLRMAEETAKKIVQ